MIRTSLLLAASCLVLAACGQGGDAANSGGDNTQGPAVSTSAEPRNPAVDTTPTTGDQAQTPGANSFTEAQARSAIEQAGYTGVGALTQTPEGYWQGPATRDGAPVTVSVDYKGAVTQR